MVQRPPDHSCPSPDCLSRKQTRVESPASSISHSAPPVTIAGEELRLLPERAVWWPRTRTLLLADFHLGKPAAFRALGVPVPEGTTRADLARLQGAIERLNAARVVILGDLLHARAGLAPEMMTAFAEWRRAHPTVDVRLVRGNHDHSAGDPPSGWGIECVEGPIADQPFVWQHEPAEHADGYVVSGHIHPAVRLYGAGASSLRAPCFWIGERCLVLPAFGSFTGAKVIRPRAGDRVFAVGEGEVIEAATCYQ